MPDILHALKAWWWSPVRSRSKVISFKGKMTAVDGGSTMDDQIAIIPETDSFAKLIKWLETGTDRQTGLDLLVVCYNRFKMDITYLTKIVKRLSGDVRKQINQRIKDLTMLRFVIRQLHDHHSK